MQWGPAATNAVAPITAVLPKTSCCKLRLRGLWSIHVSLMCISCLQLLLCEFRAQVSRKRGEAGQWQGIVTIINFSDDRLSGFYSMILCTVLQYILHTSPNASFKFYPPSRDEVRWSKSCCCADNASRILRSMYFRFSWVCPRVSNFDIYLLTLDTCFSFEFYDPRDCIGYLRT